MARLHLRARPGQHRLPREALGMVEQRRRPPRPRRGWRRRPSRRSAATFLLAGTRTRRRSAMTGSSVKPWLPPSRAPGSKAAGSAMRAAAADEGAAVGLGLRVARDAGRIGDEMRGARCPARPARACGARRRSTLRPARSRSRRTSSRRPDGRCRLASGASTSSAKEVTSIMRSRRAVVDDGDAAAFAIAFRDDDALDLGAQRADRLDEGRLVVAEDASARVSPAARLRLGGRRPPFAGRRCRAGR